MHTWSGQRPRKLRPSGKVDGEQEGCAGQGWEAGSACGVKADLTAGSATTAGEGGQVMGLCFLFFSTKENVPSPGKGKGALGRALK